MIKISLVLLLLTTAYQVSLADSYNLEDLIKLGLDNSVELKTETLRYKNTESSLVSTYLDFLPSASVGASRNFINSDTENAGFNLSKSIYLNEPSYFNWKRTAIDKKNAEINLSEKRKSFIYDVFSSYVRVKEAQKRVQIQTNNYSLQQRIHDQTMLLFELDKRSQLDVKQSQISLINAQISLENAENQLVQARENLFYTVNIDDRGYELADIDISLKEADFDYHNPVSVTIAENAIKKTQLSLTQSKLSFLPTLYLSYNYSYSYPGPNLADGILDIKNYKDSYTLSLNASYSLFNFLKHGQEHSRTNRSYLSQNYEYDNLIASESKRYKQLIRDFGNEQRLYELAQRKNELAKETLELAQSKFNLGVLSLLEYDQAQKDFLESEIDLSTRYYQLLLKQEELNLFLSKPLLGKW